MTKLLCIFIDSFIYMLVIKESCIFHRMVHPAYVAFEQCSKGVTTICLES